MYLKTLTLKGFKSFADPTTLELEPGVTVVVGPNGSGKSNVVDAIAWVLGAQGPRVVRSAKMDDVIFAGTDKRSALGRAEVALTIDNTSRRLPIEFNEVTISRTLFRSGESEYALNGVPCRLLDIQELLSDSGVGRSQHVIIGQGQLDVVLAQRPEDRRLVIEEAAGILKYRRRRERAERRLESSEAALARLTDLLREVRRQVRPLERQAASAIRHDEIETELHALRLYLSGQELNELDNRRFAIDEESRATEIRAGSLAAELVSLESSLSDNETRLSAARAEGVVYALGRAERLHERARGLEALVAERRRARDELLALLDGNARGEGLQSELSRTAEELDRLDGELESLTVVERSLAGEEATLALAEEDHNHRFGAVEDDSPIELATVRVEHNRARTAQSRAGEEAARATEKLAGLERDMTAITSRCEEIEQSAAAALAALTDAHRSAARAKSLEDRRLLEATEANRTLESCREDEHAARARLGALLDALDAARARAGLASLGEHPGVLGTAFDLLNPPEELIGALSAALETMLDAVVVRDAEDAAGALRRLREGDGAGAVVARDELPPPSSAFALPAGLTWLADELSLGEASARRFAQTVLRDVALCRGGFEAALVTARAHPELVIVTTEGDRFARGAWRVGLRTNGASPLVIDRAREVLALAASATESAHAVAEAAGEQLERARVARQECDAECVRHAANEAHERAELARARRSAESIERALEAARAAAIAATTRLEELSGSLTGIEGRLFALEELGQAQLERTNERLEAVRALEMRRSALSEARHELALRRATFTERRQVLAERETELRAAIAQRAIELEHAEAVARDETTGTQLHSASERLSAASEQLARLVTGLRAMRDARVAEQAEIASVLAQLRERRSEVESLLERGRERRQELEIERTEVRVRTETALETLRRELGSSPETARTAPRPDLPDGEEPADRAATLEAELVTLGPVNPLARDELASLTERSGFLETQLEDVRGARRELHQVIAAIDAEIVEIFSEAFADVAEHFSVLFELLFPGGTGRLVLTEPDEPLTTGVDIEARPAGRNVRRLSLLSGGERSLTAMAFLFAVFRSRPSPFYVLDEVEAALDEVNLRRFLGLLEEFRDEAQLIVVSHQKKTMESADALYGVTMQPGGASRVVSERVAREEMRRELSSP